MIGLGDGCNRGSITITIHCIVIVVRSSVVSGIGRCRLLFLNCNGQGDVLGLVCTFFGIDSLLARLLLSRQDTGQYLAAESVDALRGVAQPFQGLG